MSFFITIIGFLGMLGFMLLWIINKIRRKPKGNEFRIVVMCFALFIVGIIISPSSNELSSNIDRKVEDETKVITLEKKADKNDYLKDDVTLLQETEVDMDSYKFSIVGFKVDNSSGDIIEDTFAGNGLVNETSDESTQRGFQIGFENGKAEVKNRDGYLSIYLKFDFYEEEMAQRDSIIPKIKIKVKDNKGDEGILLYNSQKDKYIDLKSPYGVMLYKIYLDSEEFEITIDNTRFILNISELI